MKAVAIETFQRDKTILTEEIHLLQANVTYLDQLVNRFKSEKELVEEALKTMSAKLRCSTEEIQFCKQKIENQRTQLHNLNTKSNQIKKLNTEITKLKTQLTEKTDLIQKSNLMNTQLEQKMKIYEEIVNNIDKSTQKSSKIGTVGELNQECTICCEEFNKDRKKIAFGPCGHCTVCAECSKAMKRNVGRRQKNDCPICRTEIKFTLVLEGIY